MRGDDVASLQSVLGQLGFDSGRVDGIFGPNTAHALTEFQSNYGSTVDGICGPDTARVLLTLRGKSGSGEVVAMLRERERHRRGRHAISHHRVAVGHFGGLSILSRDVVRSLRAHGASVLALDDPDPVLQAVAANRFEADVYLGFEANADQQGTAAHYYRVPTFHSPSGRALAELLAHDLAEAKVATPVVSGMRLPILRETQMPAALVVTSEVRTFIDHSPGIGDLAARVLNLWTSHRC